MSNDAFQERSSALEGAFFNAVDKTLIDDLKKELDLQNQKEALSAATGVSDDGTLEKLAELNVNVEALSAFSLYPLVAVAWADGTVEEAEREAIMKAAGGRETTQGKASMALLEDWLTRQPDDDLLSTWTEYVQAISKVLEANELAQLKSDILGGALAVAQAAGGFLGLVNKVSAREQAVLDELKKAFE